MPSSEVPPSCSPRIVLGSAADVFGIGKAYGIVAALPLAAVATTVVVNHRTARSS